MEDFADLVVDDAPDTFDAPYNRRVVYDSEGRVVVVVEVRNDKTATALDILRAIEFLQEYWSVEEQES